MHFVLWSRASAVLCMLLRGFHNSFQTTKISEPEMSEDDKIKHSKYLVNVLFPFLEQFDQEQNMEKKIEAKIQGITSTLFSGVDSSCFDELYCQ